MSAILITGITGFAGTNLVRFFAKKGGVKIFGHSRNNGKAKAQFEKDNVTLIPEISVAMLNYHNIDCVIHLAGIAHDLSNVYKPEDYYEVNQKNTQVVYDQFLKSNVSRFVYLSSIKAVADTASTPVTEDAIPVPVTHYGKSKQLAEVYIQQQLLPPGKRYYILRPCMIHGRGNKGNLNLLYKFIKRGLPFPLGAYDNKRSFLSVDNFTFVIDKLIYENIPSGIYHLADSGYLSTAQLVTVMAKPLNKRSITLNIPKPVMTLLFTLMGKRPMLGKLTEDMMVSNEKILSQIKTPLPVKVEEGIINTVKSFNEH